MGRGEGERNMLEREGKERHGRGGAEGGGDVGLGEEIQQQFACMFSNALHYKT